MHNPGLTGALWTDAEHTWGLCILILSLITDTLPPLVSRSKLAEIGYSTEVFDSKTVPLWKVIIVCSIFFEQNGQGREERLEEGNLRLEEGNLRLEEGNLRLEEGNLLFTRGRDDLRVVRYRCMRVWQDYQLLETPRCSCGFQSARGRHGGRPSPTE